MYVLRVARAGDGESLPFAAQLRAKPKMQSISGSERRGTLVP